VFNWTGKGYEANTDKANWSILNENINGVNVKSIYGKFKQYQYLDCQNKVLKVKSYGLQKVVQSYSGETYTIYFKVINDKPYEISESDYVSFLVTFETSFNDISLKTESNIPSDIKTQIFDDLLTIYNSNPIADSITESIDEDTVLTSSLTGSDEDNDILNYEVVNEPTNGILTLNSNGSYSYIPNANYNGSDSFTYKVNDSSLYSSSKTVDITINPMYDLPDIQPTLNADLNTIYQSGEIYINDDVGTTASVNTGSIILNGVDVGKSTTLKNGDIIKIPLNSSSSFDTITSAIVTIGSDSKTYSVRTLSKLFTNIDIAKKSTYYTSNEITIWADNTSVSIDNGILLKNDSQQNDTSITANNGDTISIRLQSGANIGDEVSFNINVGSVSDTWMITTKPNDFDLLTNGTYSQSGTSFYYMTLNSTSNVDFNVSSYPELTIYDEDMNIVKSKTTYDQTYSLNAGTYIVKIYNDGSNDSITVYSTALN
jgi:ribosomal 50S subunit-recycling heat shock protein